MYDTTARRPRSSRSSPKSASRRRCPAITFALNPSSKASDPRSSAAYSRSLGENWTPAPPRVSGTAAASARALWRRRLLRRSRAGARAQAVRATGAAGRCRQSRRCERAHRHGDRNQDAAGWLQLLHPRQYADHRAERLQEGTLRSREGYSADHDDRHNYQQDHFLEADTRHHGDGAPFGGESSRTPARLHTRWRAAHIRPSTFPSRASR